VPATNSWHEHAIHVLVPKQPQPTYLGAAFLELRTPPRMTIVVI
jgi:hypothetical protein